MEKGPNLGRYLMRNGAQETKEIELLQEEMRNWG
jgi:hypothetical protein